MSGSIGSTPEIELLSPIVSDFGCVSPKMEVSRAAKREVRVCTLGIYSKQLLSRAKFIVAAITMCCRWVMAQCSWVKVAFELMIDECYQ